MRRPTIRHALAVCAVLAFALLGAPAPARAASLVFLETEFPSSRWHQIVMAFNDRSDSRAESQHVATGGIPGAYWSVQIFLGASTDFGVSVFAGYVSSAAVWDPATDGPVTRLDYAEMARTLTGRVQRTGPALVQDGRLFCAVLPDAPLFTSSSSWELLTATGLGADDFVWPGTSIHPDFSASGKPISFGFYRANSGLPHQPGGVGPVCGIDNWRIEVNAAPRVQIGDEIRVETTAAFSPVDDVPVSSADTDARPPFHAGDLVDASSSVATPNGGGTASSRARSSLSGGLGAESLVLGPAATPAGGGMLVATARASHVRKFVAQVTPPATHLSLDILNFAEGTLDVADTQTSNTAAPSDGDLSAAVAIRVLLHRASGPTTLLNGTATLYLTSPGGNPGIQRSGSAAFQSSFSYPTPEFGVPFAQLAYSELLTGAASIPDGEEFALEFEVATAATAGVPAAAWSAEARFYDTFRATPSTATPGAKIVEVFEAPSGAATGAACSGTRGLRVPKLADLDRAAQWTVAVADGGWFAQESTGLRLKGGATSKGRTKRNWRLSPDAASLAALAAAISQEVGGVPGGEGLVVTLPGAAKAPKARWAISADGTSAKFTWSVPMLLSGRSGKLRAKWKLTLTASLPPAR